MIFHDMLSQHGQVTLGAETFINRNFREFREFRPNLRKFMTQKFFYCPFRLLAKVYTLVYARHIFLFFLSLFFQAFSPKILDGKFPRQEDGYISGKVIQEGRKFCLFINQM